jgi:hypothetical protein
MVFPAQLEKTSTGAFDECASLIQLLSELRSRITRLKLPVGDFGSIAIPDSVEVISRVGQICGSQSRVILFDRKSRVIEIDSHYCASD